MVQRKRWTSEEDKILVQAVKANPHNKSKAFLAVSKKTGRPVNSCSKRWYYALSNPEHKKYVGCVFAVVSRKSKLNNRIVERDDVNIHSVKIGKSIWQRIKNLLDF